MALRFACAIALLIPQLVQAEMVDFDDLPLSPDSHWNGPDLTGAQSPGPYGGTLYNGSFTSGSAQFANNYEDFYGSWSGFAYSNETNTSIAGFTNQFSTFAGAAQSGSNFGIGFGYDDVNANQLDPIAFDPTNTAHLLALPHFTVATGVAVTSAYVTNTTYAALSMTNGDGFAKKFGGDTGNDADWLKLSAYGIDEFGQALGATVEFYLADYRFTDNTQDYIVDEWTLMDLSSLAGAQTIAFNLSSSDSGPYGMNTPAYFAIDSIDVSSVTPVPEPGSLALLLIGSAVAGVSRTRRGRRQP
ncbi:DUF4465 domain-containing protein [Thalassoglobus sp. JC818]|uniref:DUF4465 domain-containing protein n=1 Tax=Thalassoglobus sp. JC818 TaxID=3232136 RepID=UPI003457F46C